MKNPKINETLKYMHTIAHKLINTKRSRSLIQNMYMLSKKYQVRLDKSIKRDICKKCYNILIEKVTCESKISREVNGVFFVIICGCGEEKRFCFKGMKGLSFKSNS